MTTTRFLFLTFLFLAFTGFVHAQAGKTGLSFLKIGIGARTVAMGDAGVALGDGAAAPYYNPASMMRTSQTWILLMHNEWVQDVSSDYIGVVLPFDGWRLAFNANRAGVSNIEVRDRPGVAEGMFDSHSFTLGTSMAFDVVENLSVGASVKYVFEKIYVDQAGGYAFDLGVSYATPIEGLHAGYAVSNLGEMGVLRNERTKLPALHRVGAAYETPIPQFDATATFVADGFSVFDEKKLSARFGAELNYSKSVFARLGYQTGSEIYGFSGGIGVSFSALRFDYALTPFSSEFGSAHTISISIQF